MKAEEKKCTEFARITLPWGGNLLNYCPVHANQMVMLGNAMGSPIRAQMLPSTVIMQCESNTPLTDEEKELAKIFPVHP